jgi:hypothetical protein
MGKLSNGAKEKKGEEAQSDEKQMGRPRATSSRMSSWAAEPSGQREVTPKLAALSELDLEIIQHLARGEATRRTPRSFTGARTRSRIAGEDLGGTRDEVG